jgi:amidophosphoribosyltransferase
LVKNRYVGRTFIQPAQTMRERGVRMKLNAMPGVIEGKRVVLVDDSIVRGSTTQQLVALVREAGATEVHLRISSPPYRWPCFYGMDTGDRSTLLAAGRSVDEIAEHLGVDSLVYLDLANLIEATGAEPDSFCTACLSGNYPTDVPLADGKFLLEQTP